MSRIVWKITLYHVSHKSGYKVKVEGNPRPGPWVFATGNGHTPGDALNNAADQMAQIDQDDFLAFLDNSSFKV
jgi:hypothetical protein